MSLLLSLPQKYIALNVLIWDQTQGCQMGVRVDTTKPPAGAPIVAMELLNKHIQNCCLGLSWEVVAAKVAFTPEKVTHPWFR